MLVKMEDLSFCLSSAAIGMHYGRRIVSGFDISKCSEDVVNARGDIARLAMSRPLSCHSDHETKTMKHSKQI